MRKSLFATLLAGAVLCACSDKNSSDQSLQITADDVIYLDGNFDDNFLESWEYVLLDDSNPDALLGDIDGIFYDDDLFFVLSGTLSFHTSQIKVFDCNGKYLHDIGHEGRARNEYLHICEWMINTSANEIIVHDNYANALKRYDYDGNYLGEMIIPGTDIKDGFINKNPVKCLSNGSILFQGGLAVIPTYDYFYVNPDSTLHSPLQITGYRAYCDMDPFEYSRMVGDIGFVGTTICFSDITSDTSYVLRVLDNHIYKLSANSVQCLANMAFLPEVSRKVRMSFDDEAQEKYYGISIPIGTFDLNKYMLMYFPDEDYVYEKASSKMYHVSHVPNHVSLSNMLGERTIHGNAIIGCVEDYHIERTLSYIDSPDYDHRYTSDVEAFYRKVATHENAAIIIAHYK